MSSPGVSLKVCFQDIPTEHSCKWWQCWKEIALKVGKKKTKTGGWRRAYQTEKENAVQPVDPLEKGSWEPFVPKSQQQMRLNLSQERV